MSAACRVCGRSEGQLLDRASIMREYGVSGATADRMMEKVPKIVPDGIRKVFVRRSDVDALLESWTRAA